MTSMDIFLPTPESVQEFVEILSELDGNFDLVSGNYILDARSLMGIFSFDLTKPVRLNIHSDTEKTRAALSRFAAQDEENPSPEKQTRGNKK